MQILNFVPLLIWSLVFPTISSWDEHRMVALGKGDRQDSDQIVYLFGCGLWLIIGIWA